MLTIELIFSSFFGVLIFNEKFSMLFSSSSLLKLVLNIAIDTDRSPDQC